ncbi:MAG: chloride channel protein, partial [Collinsella sp.]
FSLNDVIMAGRQQLTRSEHLLAADTRRNVRNLLASAKLLVLVVIVSLAMGVAAWAFLASLNIATDYREQHAWVYALLPAVGVATAWVYKNHGLAAKRGNNLVIDSAPGHTPHPYAHGRPHLRLLHAHHLTGGQPVARAAVQIGGTIASNISSLAHLKKHDHHDLMLAGISSAFGAVFGSPLAGAFFGMEMCFIGKIDYTAGIYCLVASFTGYFTSLALGTEYEANVIASVPNMTPRTVVIVVISAIIFGLTARLFAWSVRTVKSLYGRLITNYLVRALIGALVVLAAYALLDAWNYAGLATWLSGAGFSGNTTLADASIKLVVTALTLGAGFQGGEVTPLFGIGAALGGWIGCLTGLDPSFLAALGMLGVFCAGLNVPITTCMMAIDLFHGTAAGFFVIVAFISYLTGGHRGVYPAQRIISPKRRSLIVDEGGTVAELSSATTT